MHDHLIINTRGCLCYFSLYKFVCSLAWLHYNISSWQNTSDQSHSEWSIVKNKCCMHVRKCEHYNNGTLRHKKKNTHKT